MGARLVLWCAVVLAALLCAAGAARAAFPQDPPNDPGYDAQGPNCIDDKQYELFDSLPSCAPGATDPEGPSGLSVDRAWRDFTTGNPETVIAYVEAGINWRDPNAVKELANKVYLNDGELPAPTTPAQGDASCGTGVLCAADFSDTSDSNLNGAVDPEDLIVRYTDRRDDDGNGYPDDISGWDFYDNQNDPATNDSSYSHANNQMERVAGETDNATAGAGVCPRCRVLPVKAGAEALDRTDDLAESWLYAVDAGASVIVSVTADLGYSTFMRQTAEYVSRKGVVAVAASNDFDSTDHQGGMFHPHVLPGNGMVANRLNFMPLSATTTTYRERSSVTSWGAHNVFTVATNSGTTSASTPTLGGAVGLVTAYSREAASQGNIPRALTAQEVVQVMKATASDVNDPSLAWPSKAGWDLQFGYGRPNVHKAMHAIATGNVPPTAFIDSPDWFTFEDPERTPRVRVAGRIDASRSSGYTWKLEAGLGGEPSEAQFSQVASGTGSAPREGELGQVDLARIATQLSKARFTLSERKELETTERYTVTLRLRVTDAQGRVGEDRRAFFARHDDSLVAGFPKRIGPGGDGQAVLADLTGKGRLDIVFGDTDGRVHAIDPVGGGERPGFPARTEPTKVQKGHTGVAPGNEPIVTNLAVGDLDGTGALQIVGTTTTGRTYIWGERGRRRRGWPKTLDTGVVPMPIPRPDLDKTRKPARGAFAAPVLHDMNGDGKLEVIQAGWDGRLHVFRGNGSELPGFPVKVVLPDSARPLPGQERVNDEKLDGTPAVADLNGDGKPELVVRSQFTDISTAVIPDPQVVDRGYLHAYDAKGRVVPGWPVAMPGVAEVYGSAQEFITEGSNSPVAADVDGNGDHEVVSNPVLSPALLYDGDGSLRTTYAPLPPATAALFAGQVDPQKVLARDLPADVPVGFTTSGAFGRFGGGLTYAQPGSGTASIGAALLLPGLGNPIVNYERAFDARTGATRPGFPSELQGLDFLGAPLIVDVTGDGAAEIVDGGDSNAVHGYTASGAQAAGFPKFNSGWGLWSPSAGDLDSDGDVEIVQLTREGYLFAWRTQGKAEANEQWWRWHHDERSTGLYGLDARPPGTPRGVKRSGRTVSFVAPGDDWYAGKVARYRVTPVATGDSARARRTQARGAPVAAGKRQRLSVGGRATRVSIQAVDDAGNRGRPVEVRLSATAQDNSDAPTGRREDDAGQAAGAGEDGDLPFTGLLLLALVALGLALLLGGRLMQRLSGRA